VWAQWKPGVGWKIIVHQDGDESVVQVTVPDDGKSLIYFWREKVPAVCHLSELAHAARPT
jgi:hypothetical protein